MYLLTPCYNETNRNGLFLEVGSSVSRGWAARSLEDHHSPWLVVVFILVCALLYVYGHICVYRCVCDVEASTHLAFVTQKCHFLCSLDRAVIGLELAKQSMLDNQGAPRVCLCFSSMPSQLDFIFNVDSHY